MTDDLKAAGRAWASKHSGNLAALEAVSAYHYHDPDNPNLPDFNTLLDQMWSFLCNDPERPTFAWSAKSQSGARVSAKSILKSSMQ